MSESDEDFDPQVTHSVGQQLLERALDHAAGKTIDYCWGRPEKDYYVANLSPGSIDDDSGESEEGPFSESKPSMVGLRWQPSSAGTAYEVTFDCDFYVRCLPTPKRVEQAGRAFSKETLDEQFYEKRSVSATTTIDITDPEEEVEKQVEEVVTAAIDEEWREAAEEYLLYPQGGIQNGDIVDRLDGETSAGEYREAVTAVAERASLEQAWSVGCEFSRGYQSDHEEREEVTLKIHNTSSQITFEFCGFLFNQQLSVSGGFTRYQFRAVPRDYRYGRDLWGKGLNASIDTTGLDDTDSQETTGELRTTQIPTHQSYRFEHREFPEDIHDGDSIPDAVEGRNHTKFDHLDSGELVDHLEAIRADMKAYLSEVRGPRRSVLVDGLTDEEEREFDDTLRAFDREIQNFQRGISVLEDHPEKVQRAFRLMNRTFAEDAENFDSWYPFQLVFIVSNLPAIVDRMPEAAIEETRHDEAEVLWFPTGGGKTEAYLGLILFNLFFDRLRGKHRGVTAWIRFPLTLLGEQQMTRFLEKLIAANKIRENQGLEGERFELGYFVGGNTTPNQIEKPSSGRANNFHKTFQDDPDTLRKECKQVEECPNCGNEVTVEFDPRENRVRHFCTHGRNPDTDCSVGELPLYVTDYEIYRKVPSVLLGTLDKIAITGTNPRFANLLGNHTTKCELHGYGYSGKCSEANSIGCDGPLKDINAEFTDPIPTLHLVDEVHLLNEELGVFAAHYETMYLELCKKSDGKTPKVVTSTATISDREGVTNSPAYERLMQGLFLRDANRFPEEGPSLDESYYGTVQRDDPDERLRTFYGITPNNKTHIYAVLDLVKQYHKAIRDARRSDGEFFTESTASDELEDILFLYELSIVYFLRKTENDRFKRSIRSQINRELRNEGYSDAEELGLIELTGDIDTQGALEDLKNAKDDAFRNRDDVLTATSYISHGIDVDRFNSMFYFGFPRQTFEYIQSSSRVGRKNPGFVVDIFKPFNNRDRHRFKYFSKTHEYLDRTVEETAVARWSRFSLEKTFAGLFRAILLQYYRPRMHREHDVNVQSSKQLQDVLHHPKQYPEFQQAEFREVIEQAYGVSGEVSGEEQEYFKEKIQKRVEMYWQYWLDNLNEEFYTTFREDPMRSLRDIGESVDIRIDTDDRNLFDALSRGGD